MIESRDRYKGCQKKAKRATALHYSLVDEIADEICQKLSAA